MTAFRKNLIYLSMLDKNFHEYLPWGRYRPHKRKKEPGTFSSPIQK
jgi:hypothetical protein